MFEKLMLNPEVWNFQAPASVFQSHKVERDICLKKIRQFNFVHSVTVILPDILSVPDSFGLNLTNCDYYRVNSLTIDELVKPDFLKNFLNCGNVNLLSVNTSIDCDDCIAITTCGKLILHLNKLTFQTLGLEGKVSHFHKLSKGKYIVSIDLKSDSLKPGKAFYERVKNCLQKLKADVILQWEPPNEDICPSSISKYFFDLGYNVKLCKIKKDSETIFDVKVPVVENFDKLNQYETAKFVEWLGMVMINGSMEEQSSYISTYATPEPSIDVGQIKILRWRGFFNVSKVIHMLQEVESKYCKGQFFKAIYFQGFSDSPVVWGLNEHHFYTNGDNGGIVIMKKDEFFLCCQKCSNKYYK
ncbi:ribonuclease P protein subunit p40-like isoform X3 [Coccinella septempunctata]|uniref:ribonuclease P protein subunit p40-like isoform X3 n=1 Tax=Coccinella septempunctata TaxID=41139 RepID=UPI001D066C41|nr:ribonuclease P protein subunit p40-like isoform X3 [Coccinella septempunctata]